MFKVTAQLKEWLAENCDVAADATDEDCQKAALEALQSGDLKPEKLAELCAEKAADDDGVVEAEDMITRIIASAVDPIRRQVAEMASRNEVHGEVLETKDNTDEIVAKITDQIRDAFPEPPRQRGLLDVVTPSSVLAGTEDHTALVDRSRAQVRLKKPLEGYSHTKSAAVHGRGFMEGRPADFGGVPLDHPSEADLAVCGAFFKFAAASSGNASLPRGLRMTEHDRHIMEHAIHEMPWSGIVGGENGTPIDRRRLTDFEVKALLDDSASGGLEAAPIVFDDAVIITPVLTGELFPLVSVTPLARGRRVEAFSIGNPTFTSGTAEGTEIDLFDTSSFIAAFDTTIYNAVGAMEIGLDFEADSPVNIGALVTQRYGEKAREWLDTQIAVGDGTTEPQGVFNASGLTDIGNPAGGAGAAPQIDDYEALLFGIGKEYRPAADRGRCVYIGTDTTYRRARAIPVGSGDERRLFGMDHESYMLLGHPFKVPTGTSNATTGFFNLRYYRMYRRLGMTVRIETGGKELARKNLLLIVVRMRWGGGLELGGAGSYSDNFQA